MATAHNTGKSAPKKTNGFRASRTASLSRRFVAHLADRLVYFLVVNPSRFQCFPGPVGGKHLSYRCFVCLPRFCSFLNIFAKLARRNSMIFLLRARGKGTRGHQACSKQNRAQTHRVAKLHLSSRLLGALILWVRAGATQAVYLPLIAQLLIFTSQGLAG